MTNRKLLSHICDLPSKSKGKLKIDLVNIPNGKYAVEVYKVGYRSNDAYSSYLSMGKPAQLTNNRLSKLKGKTMVHRF
jgi:xylan 1,4-beta-xylosidase